MIYKDDEISTISKRKILNVQKFMYHFLLSKVIRYVSHVMERLAHLRCGSLEPHARNPRREVSKEGQNVYEPRPWFQRIQSRQRFLERCSHWIRVSSFVQCISVSDSEHNGKCRPVVEY